MKNANMAWNNSKEDISKAEKTLLLAKQQEQEKQGYKWVKTFRGYKRVKIQ